MSRFNDQVRLDLLTISLQLTAAQNGGTAFSSTSVPVRFLRVL